MRINDVEFNASLEDILDEIDSQLTLNGLQPFRKRNDSRDDIMVCCPYHNERRPSAGMRKSDGLFHCFACGEVHPLYEVISYCFGKSDDVLGTFGWSWLLKNFATMSIEQRKPIELNITRDKTKAEVKYVTEEELDGYRYTHPYMYERKLTDEIIEMFDIGYDNDNRCITFPIRDVDGNCLFVARRSVQTKFFSYPQGVEKPLYGIYELNQLKQFPKEVIICESMLDALVFWVVGKYAVALNGTGSDLQMKQLNMLPSRKLILCTDMDEAGLKARQNIRRNVNKKIITEYILPEGRKDANDCTLQELETLQEIF